MEDNAAEPPAVELFTAEPPPGATPPPAGGRRWWVNPVRWVGELATVFAGVYAAFALNNYQVHRQERQRRDQILNWAQGEYAEALAGFNDQIAHQEEIAKEFDQKVKAGEMPPLHAFTFVTDYNPTDFTSMLQSGGFDLLDIQTIRAIRAIEGTLRQFIELMHHDQQLSDALLLPNLDQPASFFYDASGKQLRAEYRWYSDYFTANLLFRRELRTELTQVLKQLRTEGKQNR